MGSIADNCGTYCAVHIINVVDAMAQQNLKWWSELGWYSPALTADCNATNHVLSEAQYFYTYT